VQRKYEAIKKDRDELNERVNLIQSENDAIKIKFAKLLDQFQEYVNDNEFR
jgi:uncharacterized coiled-coil DUF342 family protein